MPSTVLLTTTMPQTVWIDAFSTHLSQLAPGLSPSEAQTFAVQTFDEAADLDPIEAAEVFALEMSPADVGSPRLESNMIASTEDMALEYYRAAAEGRRPAFVPSKVGLTRQVRGDSPFRSIKAEPAVIQELQTRARSHLASALALYIDALGTKEGFEAASDALFSELAVTAYPGGWPGLLAYSMRAAG